MPISQKVSNYATGGIKDPQIVQALDTIRKSVQDLQDQFLKPNVVFSPNCGTFVVPAQTDPNAGFVPGLSASITTRGRPVAVYLQYDPTYIAHNFYISNLVSGFCASHVYIFKDGIQLQDFTFQSLPNIFVSNLISMNPAEVSLVDIVPTGTYNYSISAISLASGGFGDFYMEGIQLVLREL